MLLDLQTPADMPMRGPFWTSCGRQWRRHMLKDLQHAGLKRVLPSSLQFALKEITFSEHSQVPLR